MRWFYFSQGLAMDKEEILHESGHSSDSHEYRVEDSKRMSYIAMPHQYRFTVSRFYSSDEACYLEKE